MVGSHKDNTYLQQFNVLHALTWYAVKCACGLIGNRSILRNGCSNVPWRLCASSHLGEPPQCFSMALDLCLKRMVIENILFVDFVFFRFADHCALWNYDNTTSTITYAIQQVTDEFQLRQVCRAFCLSL